MHQNIFQNIPSHLAEEIFENIIVAGYFKIERIISRGHASPPGFWYDQEMNEWVLLLQGKARLRFAKNDEIVEMKAGDYVNIPAHCKHRVEWTTPDENTIWLAIYYR